MGGDGGWGSLVQKSGKKTATSQAEQRTRINPPERIGPDAFIGRRCPEPPSSAAACGRVRGQPGHAGLAVTAAGEVPGGGAAAEGLSLSRSG